MNRSFCFIFPLLGLLSVTTLLTSCHDKRQTVVLEEELDSLTGKLTRANADLDATNASSRELSQKVGALAADKTRITEEETKTSSTRQRLKEYRESIEKALGELTAAVANYRTEQLKP